MERIDCIFEVVENRQLNTLVHFLRVKPKDNRSIPKIYPGQFVNIKLDAPDVFLRRPISICNYDRLNNEIWLIVKNVGKGSAILCHTGRGDVLDILIPLGKGFDLPTGSNKSILLIGGGVGVAPLYFLGRWLTMLGQKPSVLIGARSKEEFFFIDKFKEIGEVYLTTEDGSSGTQGLVTEHDILKNKWSQFYVCGPTPMMKAIGKLAREKNINCQISLENKMACGVGACLCCVEKTVRGNVCTCTDGPVFDITDLTW